MSNTPPEKSIEHCCWAPLFRALPALCRAGQVTAMRHPLPGWLGIVPAYARRDAFRRPRRALLCAAAEQRLCTARGGCRPATPRAKPSSAVRSASPTSISSGLVVRCAAGLRALGIASGDRVGLLLANGIAFPVVLFAVLRLGAIAVPISTREQTPGLAYMLAHCGAKVLVHEADLADRLPLPGAAPALAHRIAVTPGGPCGGLDALFGDDSVAQPADVDEEDTAIILYTSGTTGRPKGAMLTHLGICHSAMHYECCMGLSARDRSVIAVPMSHVTGVIALIAAMVRAAGTPDRHADVQRRRVSGAGRARAHDAHTAGAGHVQFVPDRASLRACGFLLLAARRLRRRADGTGDHRAVRVPSCRGCPS